jgi:hypothetical protein
MGEQGVQSVRLKGPGLRGQRLGFVQRALEQRPHRPHRRPHPLVNGHVELFRQPGTGGDVGLHRPDVPRLERAGHPPTAAGQLHLLSAVARASRSISSARAERSSSPSGPHTAIQRARSAPPREAASTTRCARSSASRLIGRG